jgi:acyl carrier protein
VSKGLANAGTECAENATVNRGESVPPTQSIEERIREFIIKQFPLAKKQEFEASQNWLESGLIDSLGILDVVHFLETDFSVQISDDELLPENFQSLEAVCAFVRRKIEHTT